MIEDALRSRAWIVDALGELIAAAPSMHKRPQGEDVLRGIETAFRLAALRKVTIDRRSWTRHLGLASGTVLMWRKGPTLPSLWFLLMVCSQMGISPLQLVRGEIDQDDSAVAATKAAADIRLERPPIQHTRIDPAVIRLALEAVLASDERPPPSMRLVADRLGQTYANLHHYFPELCRAVASRHRNYQEAQRARARTRLREVRDAAIALTHRGRYPSASHIADLLDDRNVMRSRTARATWHELLSELGWQHGRVVAEVADDLLTLLATSGQGAARLQTLTSSADQ